MSVRLSTRVGRGISLSVPLPWFLLIPYVMIYGIVCLVILTIAALIDLVRFIVEKVQ